MQRYLAVVMETAVKVPLQKASVYQSVTRQNAVILTPILFAVCSRRNKKYSPPCIIKVYKTGTLH